MPFPKKRGRKVIPKVTFTYAGGGYVQAFVADSDEGAEVLARWDKEIIDAPKPALWFRATDRQRVKTENVIALVYSGPEEDDE